MIEYYLKLQRGWATLSSEDERSADERQLAVEGELRQTAAWSLHLANALHDGVTVVKADEIVYLNDRVLEIFGCSKQSLSDLARLDPPGPEQSVLTFWITREDETRLYVRNRYATSPDGLYRYVITTDITKRRQAQEQIEGVNRLKEDIRADRPLEAKMKQVTDGVVDILAADFARIWLTRPGDRCDAGCEHAKVREGPHVCRERQRCLHLVASSGRYTHVDGSHARVPFGCYKIGRVAAAQESGFLTNDVANDPRVHNQQWARPLGLVSFAGYRLQARDGQPIGVLALFSKHELSANDEALLKTLANIASNAIIDDDALRALRDSEERYRRLTENAQDMIWRTNADARLLYVNRFIERLLGWSPVEVVGRPASELVTKEALERINRLTRQCTPRAPHFRIEADHLHREGHLVCCEMGVSVVFDPEGRVEFIEGVTRDITERKRSEQERDRLEEQLHQSQKMEAIGRLAGGVAHDFNNVLCAISGNAVLAQLDLEPDHQLYELMAEINKAADRATELTQQLLAFSRKQIISPRVVDLNVVIERQCAMLARLIGEDIIFRSVPQRDLGSVCVDPGQIEQIVLNLAINARDAMPDGGELVIETRDLELDASYCDTHPGVEPGAYVMLAVSDTGSGMSPEVIERVFEPFYTTKQLGQGTGLGLATVFGIVEQNGGRIEVCSEEGKGSSFKVYFPRVEQQAEQLARSERGEAPRGKETVLVVEDDKIVRTLAVRILQRYGYEVLQAASGDEALALDQQHVGPIDLLLTDVVMPRMNGRELAKRFVERRPEIKVLYTSGYTQNVIAQHGVLDNVHFLPKPYSLDTLAAVIRELLDSD